MKLYLLFFLCSAVSLCKAQSDTKKILEDSRQLAFSDDTAFIKSHPHSLKSLSLLNFHYSSLPYRFVTTYFNLLDKKLIETKEYKELASKIEAGKHTLIGDYIKTFVFSTPARTTVSVDSITKKNKLVLVDFWPSWCLPCKNNIQFLKTLYDTYQKNGLEILSISVDENKADWLQAIQNDGIAVWQHGIDDAAKSIQNQLGIYAVPTYLLLDTNRKILGRFNGRWNGQEDMEKTIRQLILRNENELQPTTVLQ